MKLSGKKLTGAMHTEARKELMRYVRNLQSVVEMDQAFRLIMTSEEYDTVLRRMMIAKLLTDGVRYKKIVEQLGVSKLTVSKVRDLLALRGYGRNPARHRVYSSWRKEPKRKPRFGYYKGVPVG